MDDDPKKQAKRKKLEEHRKWLEDMKLRQSKISASHISQIPERKRTDVYTKTKQECQPRIDFATIRDDLEIEREPLTEKSRDKNGGSDCGEDVVLFFLSLTV